MVLHDPVKFVVAAVVNTRPVGVGVTFVTVEPSAAYNVEIPLWFTAFTCA